jgi:hypothetical protein
MNETSAANKSKGFLNKMQESLLLDAAAVFAGLGGGIGASLYDMSRRDNPFSSKNSRQNYEIGAQERKRFNEISNDYQQHLINNKNLDGQGYFNSKFPLEVFNKGNANMFAYARQIGENGTVNKLIKNDGHAKNSQAYDYFREIIHPVKENGRNMEGVILLGRMRNKKLPELPAIKPGSGSFNNIANNIKMSSPLYRTYNIYSRPYSLLKNLYYNPQDIKLAAQGVLYKLLKTYRKKGNL